MQLYYLTTEDSVFNLKLNLEYLLGCLLPDFEQVRLLTLDKYKMLVPRTTGNKSYPPLDLPLPPLSVLNKGVLSFSEDESYAAFEFLNRTLYVCDYKQFIDYDIFRTEMLRQTSLPADVYIGKDIDNKSLMESNHQILFGYFPIYYLKTDIPKYNIFVALGKLLDSNPYLSFEDLSIQGNLVTLPLLDDNMYTDFINSLEEEPANELKCTLLESIAYRQVKPSCYYLHGVLYYQGELPEIDIAQVQQQITTALSVCDPSIDLISLSSINELTEYEQLHTIQLSDQSCITLSTEAIEFLVNKPLTLKTQIPIDNIESIEYHANAVIGFRDLIVGSTLIVSGTIVRGYNPIDISELEVLRTNDITTIRYLGKDLLESDDIHLTKYGKAYYTSYGYLPEYCVK